MLGKILIFSGIILLLLGLFISIFELKFSWFGNLIGDFKYDGEKFKIYAPITSMLLISIIFTILINFLKKF